MQRRVVFIQKDQHFFPIIPVHTDCKTVQGHRYGSIRHILFYKIKISLLLLIQGIPLDQESIFRFALVTARGRLGREL